ncbi:hypothetical protein MK131_11205 [Candidatus Poribacteria bacterium]|nr:hypothetical protein [Candidatus Poribacteria bacterium]
MDGLFKRNAHQELDPTGIATGIFGGLTPVSDLDFHLLSYSRRIKSHIQFLRPERISQAHKLSIT